MNIKFSHKIYAKRSFNPNNANDLWEYSSFMNTDSWKDGCPFYLEWPFLSVPDMIKSKIVETHLETLIKLKSDKVKPASIQKFEQLHIPQCERRTV